MMKIIAPVLLLVVGALCATEKKGDPFGSPPLKRAVDLVKCVHGHDTLKEVEVVYGQGAENSPEIAAKLEHGEATLGGCIIGPRDYWVYCRTCGLCFDDEFDSWRDERQCSIAEVRLLRSLVLQEFTVAHADEAERIAFTRWLGPRTIEGERISYWVSGSEESIVSALKKWAPKDVKITAPKRHTEDRESSTWKWKSDGNDFELNYLKVFGSKLETHLQIEWHRIPKKAAPSDGDKPAK